MRLRGLRLTRLLPLLLALALGGCSSAGLLRLASAADAINPAVTVQADLPYGERAGQRLDLYRPARPPATGQPLVVFVHGGSWIWGAKDQYRFVGAALAERGITVAVVNYRLYPAARLDDSLDDVVAAVARLQRMTPLAGVDGTRTVLMGHSAGAQLAALVALDPARLRAAGAAPVRGFVGLAGPYDFLPLQEDYQRVYFGPPERFGQSQPVNAVTAASPPALLVQGRADTTVRPANADALAARLRAADVPVQILWLDEDDHAAVLRRFARPYRAHDPLLQAVQQFVRDVP